jgi:hypothetical protein
MSQLSTGRHGFSATLRNCSIMMTTEIKTIIDIVHMHHHETPPYEADSSSVAVQKSNCRRSACRTSKVIPAYWELIYDVRASATTEIHRSQPDEAQEEWKEWRKAVFQYNDGT